MTIILFETFRAVFYTPFYAALALDAYKAEGVDVRLETAPSPEATASGLLSASVTVTLSVLPPLTIQYDFEDGNADNWTPVMSTGDPAN